MSDKTKTQRIEELEAKVKDLMAAVANLQSRIRGQASVRDVPVTGIPDTWPIWVKKPDDFPGTLFPFRPDKHITWVRC